MSYPIVFHPDVADEVDDAYRWYERQRPGLGRDFLAELDVVYAALMAFPQVHQIIWSDIRRTRPKRFPYAIFYRLHPDRVEVVAVQHSRRNPKDWQSRS